MDINHFLAMVKTNQLSLHPVARHKIEGGISHIRAQTEAKLTTNGIAQYSQLGSQNAISYMPDLPLPPDPAKLKQEEEASKKKAEEERRKQNEEFADEIAKKMADEIAKDMNKPGPGPGQPGPPVSDKAPYGRGGFAGAGMGGTQSEKSKHQAEVQQARKDYEEERDRGFKEQAERDNTPVPANKPPFNIYTDEGRAGLKAWEDFLGKKFSYTEAERKIFSTKSISEENWSPLMIAKANLIPEVRKDSEGFSKFYLKMKDLDKQVKDYNDDWKSNFAPLLNNLISIANFGIDQAASMGKGMLLDKIRPKATETNGEFGPMTRDQSDIEALKSATNFLIDNIPTNVAIDKFANYVKDMLPKQTVPFPEKVHEFYNRIFEMHPKWRQKIQEIRIDKQNKQMEEFGLGGNDFF